MLTDRDRLAAMAIVALFENPKLGAYSSVAILNDKAGISYGLYQFTRRSGKLNEVVERYVQLQGSCAEALKPYTNRLHRRDASLDQDEGFKHLLRRAGSDPAMHRAQIDVALNTIRRAEKFAGNMGIGSPLGVAVVFDSFIQGRWRTTSKGQGMSERTTERFGPPRKIGEREWIRRYVKVRAEWLRSFGDRTPLYNSAYRMAEFEKLIAASNWNLSLPIIVRGARITATDMSFGSARTKPTTPRVAALRPPDPAAARVYDAVKNYVLYQGAAALLAGHGGDTARPRLLQFVHELQQHGPNQAEVVGQVQQNLSATRLQLAGYLAALPEASRQRLSQTDLPRWLTEWSKEFGVAGIQSAEILKPATTPADLAQAVKHYVVLTGLQHHWLTGAAMPAPLAAVSRGPPTGKDAAALDRDLRRTQLGIAELVRELGPAALQLIPGWVAHDQARLGVEGVTAADVTAAVRSKARPTPQPAPLPAETALTAPPVLRPPVALAPPPLAPAAPAGLPAADAGWPASVPTTPEPALTMSAVEERLQALVTDRLDEARRAFQRTLWSA